MHLHDASKCARGTRTAWWLAAVACAALVGLAMRNAEAAQAGFAFVDDVKARQAGLVRTLAHGKADLAGDHHVLAAAFQRLADDDLLGRSREGVAARLTAGGIHEAPAPQDAHHLRDVRLGDPFGSGELRDRDARSGPLAPDLQKAAKSVLFCRAESHRVLSITECPGAVWPHRTSWPCSTADRRSPARPLP